MVYYLTACITSLSAFLGLAFSIYAIKNSDNQEKTNALYMFARSMAILFISVIPFFQRSDVLLRIITSSMLDGLSKRSKNYARFQRQIEKRHVLMYDRNGNLLIGA